ncbi:mCG145010, partial [Mus musculus]
CCGEPGSPGAPRSPFPPHPVRTLGLGSSARTARLCVVAPSPPQPEARHKSEERPTGQSWSRALGGSGSDATRPPAGLRIDRPGQVPKLFGCPQLGEGLCLF